MTVYGFDGYAVRAMNSSFFNSPYSPELFSSYFYGSPSKYTILRMATNEPIYKTISSHTTRVKDIMELPVFMEKHYVPEPGKSLYFDKACTIPRIKCEGTWKRTIKLISADAVVIPEPSVVGSTSYAVFLDQLNKSIYLMGWHEDVVPNLQVGSTIGSLVQQAQAVGKISDRYKDADYRDNIVNPVSQAVCIYIGDVLYYNEKQRFMFDVIDGLYPRIVYEGDLMQQLGTEEEKFDAAFVENVIELLNSKDRDTVHHGMRILANMDYTHYPSVTKFILQETKDNWEKCKPFNSAVRFMLDSLGNTYNPFKAVTQEEFALAKPIFEEIVKYRIAGTLRSLKNETNMTITETFAVEVTLPNPAQVEEPKDECPDCPKPEEVDFGFIQN